MDKIVDYKTKDGRDFNIISNKVVIGDAFKKGEVRDLEH